MIAGGIWLIYKEKIFIDRETGKVMEIKTPVGKFKTNVPALVLFALGFFPLIMPMFLLSKLYDPALAVRQISVAGMIEGNVYPVTVFAVMKTYELPQSGPYRFQFPVLPNYDYQLYYMAPILSGPQPTWMVGPPESLKLDNQPANSEIEIQTKRLVSGTGGH